jgi:hypothetical protein
MRESDVRICWLTRGSPHSSVVPIQPAALELLSDLSEVLARWGRWYVFDAQAVTAYGVPRLSADVDVTLKLVPDEPARFASAMKDAGFVTGLFVALKSSSAPIACQRHQRVAAR